jgi:hypothetical protein
MEDSRWWSACAWGHEDATPWIGGCNLMTYFSSTPYSAPPASSNPATGRRTEVVLAQWFYALRWRQRIGKQWGCPDEERSAAPTAVCRQLRSPKIRAANSGVVGGLWFFGLDELDQTIWTASSVQSGDCKRQPASLNILTNVLCSLNMTHSASTVRIRTSPALTNGPKKIHLIVKLIRGVMNIKLCKARPLALRRHKRTHSMISYAIYLKNVWTISRINVVVNLRS